MKRSVANDLKLLQSIRRACTTAIKAIRDRERLQEHWNISKARLKAQETELAIKAQSPMAALDEARKGRDADRARVVDRPEAFSHPPKRTIVIDVFPGESEEEAEKRVQR